MRGRPTHGQRITIKIIDRVPLKDEMKKFRKNMKSTSPFTGHSVATITLFTDTSIRARSVSAPRVYVTIVPPLTFVQIWRKQKK